MLFITIFMIPTILVFGTYEGLKNDPYYMISKYSLGNMGDASPICSKAPLALANTGSGIQLSLACPTG